MWRCLFVVAAVLAATSIGAAADDRPSDIELGKEIFSDSSLSTPTGVSCSTCHAPETGYTYQTSGLKALAVSGNRRVAPPLARNAQSVAYTAALLQDTTEQSFFWDGRARSLEEQAEGPLFSKHEMNAGSREDFCARVMTRPYHRRILEATGKAAIDCGRDADMVAAAVIRALAAFQRSPIVNRFSSRFDAYMRGESALTSIELQGLELFQTKGQCTACHLLKPTQAPLFSDFQFHQVNLPPDERLGELWCREHGAELAYDAGRTIPTCAGAITGFFKTPTLRNVTKKPFNAFQRRYGHNGTVASVTDAVRAHTAENTRGCLIADCDRGRQTTCQIVLDDDEIRAIVAFLASLEDR